jgi:hypothetical protein
MARFGRDTWALVVPDGWRAWHDEECATFVASPEVGGLQISAAFKDSEVVDSDLRGFAAEHLDAGAKPRPTQAGEFVGFENAFSNDDRFWRQWYLRNGCQMLFVTYNCDSKSRGVEDGPIGATLATLVTTGQDVA